MESPHAVHVVTFGEITLSDDPGRIDFERVHDWLSHSYWSPGISAARVRRALENTTLIVGAYHPNEGQWGVARVVTDFTRFAYLMDVIVEASQRGRGIGKAMVAYLLEHPKTTEIDTWSLATQDAHGLYEEFGFKVDPEPSRWMVRRRS